MERSHDDVEVLIIKQYKTYIDPLHYIMTHDPENAHKILEEFIEQLNEECSLKFTELDCKRFLRARKWHVDKAIDMAHACGVWRISPIHGAPDFTPESIINSCVDKNEAIYARLMPHANTGEDKFGHPIYWEKTGLISSRFVEISSLLCSDDLVVRHIRQQVLRSKLTI